MQAETIKAVVRVLKERFSNLSAEEVVDLACKIIEAIEAAKAAEKKE